MLLRDAPGRVAGAILRPRGLRRRLIGARGRGERARAFCRASCESRSRIAAHAALSSMAAAYARSVDPPAFGRVSSSSSKAFNRRLKNFLSMPWPMGSVCASSDQGTLSSKMMVWRGGPFSPRSHSSQEQPSASKRPPAHSIVHDVPSFQGPIVRMMGAPPSSCRNEAASPRDPLILPQARSTLSALSLPSALHASDRTSPASRARSPPRSRPSRSRPPCPTEISATMARPFAS